MRLRKYFLILMFSLCLVFAGAPTFAAEKAETVTIQFKWFHQFQFAGYYAAKEKGFYAEEGLDVIFRERDPQKGHIQAVLDGDAEYGVADTGLLLDRVKGKPVVLLKQIFQHSPLVFISLKDSGIISPNEMADKKVMFNPEEDSPLLAILLDTFGSLNKITTIPHSFNYEDLVTGKVDVISAYITDQLFLGKQREIPINIINPQNYGIDFYGDNLFTTEKEVTNHPKRVEKMIRASLKGWEYALGHPEEIIDLIINNYNPELAREQLIYEAKMTDLMILSEITPLGSVIPQRYEQTAEIYERAGLAESSIDPCSFIYKCNDYTSKTPGFLLTPEEKAWLDEHHIVRARVAQVPPLHFFDGKFRGISVDYLNLIAKRAGFKVQYVTDIPWSNALEHIKNHKVIDLLLTAKVTPERQNFIAFTRDYLLMPWVIFTQKDRSVDTIEALINKTVSVERNYVVHKKLVAEYPGIKLLIRETSKEAIEAVATGQADAYIGNLTIGAYIIQQYNFINLKVSAPAPFDNHDQAMAIRNDWPQLAGIINKAFNAITPAEHTAIRKKWLSIDYEQGVDWSTTTGMGSDSPVDTFKLTPKEIAWLKAHSVIRVHNEKNWPPFNFFENGRPQGLSIDYMNLLAERLNVKVEYVTGPNWNEFLGMMKRKELDVMLNIVKTEDRMKYLLFTETYARNPNAIVSLEKKPFETIEQLFGKTVAFPKGFFYEELLTKSYPQIKRLPVEDTLSSLKAVTFGKADAALGEEAVVNTLISKNMLSGLRISGEVNIGNPDLVNLRIGIRNDWPLLHSVLVKAMAGITPLEMSQIQQKWLQLDTVTPASKTAAPVSYGRLMAYAMVVFLILSLLTWILFKTIKKEHIEISFGSKWFRGFVLAGLSSFVIIICLFGWFTIERNKEKILVEVDKNLKGVLKIAEDRLDLWVAERTSFLKRLGRDPELVEITKQLLNVNPNKRALLASSALRKARAFFEYGEDIFSNIGFFIINPDHINIGSMRDANLGSRNLFFNQQPDLLDRAFQGEVGFVPPAGPDVHLSNLPKEDNAKELSTMFFVGPIREVDGQILAVMALRIDLAIDFSRALQSFGIGGTGETYAFNHNGKLLSASRYDDQLQQMGLLAEGQKSSLNLEIRDPGVNMVKGQRPKIERPMQPLTHMAARAIQLKKTMEKADLYQGHSEIETDIKGYRDYRGVPVFGAWLWNANLDIGLATEVDVDEALSNFYQTRWTVFSVLGLTLLLSVGAVLLVLLLGERTSRALMSARDNLEEKVAERTAELAEKQNLLQIAEKRSRLLLNSAGEGIFGVDADGKVVFINPAASQMLGYEPDELIGQDIHKKTHHSHLDGTPYPEKSCPMFKAYFYGSSHHVDDEVLWQKDGTHFPVEYSSTPMEKDGKLVGAVITFRDITERKQMEEALANEKERLQGILDASPIGVAFATKGIIRFANPAFKKMFSIRIGDPSPNLYVHSEERDTLINKLKAEGRVENYELQMYGRNHEVRDFIINYLPINYEGEDGILGWLLDITERKKAEKEIKEKYDELERFRRMAVGREKKMIELKKEINELLMENGLSEKYKTH